MIYQLEDKLSQGEPFDTRLLASRVGHAFYGGKSGVQEVVSLLGRGVDLVCWSWLEEGDNSSLLMFGKS